jgi:hypothetical protein
MEEERRRRRRKVMKEKEKVVGEEKEIRELKMKVEKTGNIIIVLIIRVCILLRVYPVMLINHRTQQCLVLVFIVRSHYMFGPRSSAQ